MKKQQINRIHRFPQRTKNNKYKMPPFVLKKNKKKLFFDSVKSLKEHLVVEG